MHVECVYCEVGTKFPCVIYESVMLQSFVLAIS